MSLRGDVATIMLHVEQNEEKERVARERVENLEVRTAALNACALRTTIGLTQLPCQYCDLCSPIEPLPTRASGRPRRRSGRVSDCNRSIEEKLLPAQTPSQPPI